MISEDSRAIRIPPRDPVVALNALVWLVSVPEKPSAVGAFTAAEAAEARQYTAEHGGHCYPLPLQTSQAPQNRNDV